MPDAQSKVQIVVPQHGEMQRWLTRPISLTEWTSWNIQQPLFRRLGMLPELRRYCVSFVRRSPPNSMWLRDDYPVTVRHPTPTASQQPQPASLFSPQAKEKVEQRFDAFQRDGAANQPNHPAVHDILNCLSSAGDSDAQTCSCVRMSILLEACQQKQKQPEMSRATRTTSIHDCRRCTVASRFKSIFSSVEPNQYGSGNDNAANATIVPRPALAVSGRAWIPSPCSSSLYTHHFAFSSDAQAF